MALRTGKGRIRAIAGLVAAGAVMAAILPAATAAQDKTKIVWSTWGSTSEVARFEDFNKDFMSRHPDIEVVFQPVPSYDEYHSKLLAQLISGTAPDLFYVGDNNIGKFVDSGVMLPVDQLMSAADSKITADSFLDGLYGAAR